MERAEAKLDIENYVEGEGGEEATHSWLGVPALSTVVEKR